MAACGLRGALEGREEREGPCRLRRRLRLRLVLTLYVSHEQEQA